jgi:hypothetical protein
MLILDSATDVELRRKLDELHLQINEPERLTSIYPLSDVRHFADGAVILARRH